MQLQEFTQEMQRRGLLPVEDKLFCGSYGAYPLSVTFAGGKAGGKTSYILSVLLDKPARRAKSFKDAIKSVKGRASVTLSNAGNANVGQFIVNVKRQEDFAGAFDGFVAALVQTAQQYDLHPPVSCPICHKEGCDAYALVDYYRPVHGDCVQQQATKRIEKAEDNALNGNYIIGIVGAFLGGIVGALPTVLTVMLFDVISVWLCALVPLGAYFGYKLLRGKMNRAVLPIVIVVSLLVSPVMCYLSFAASLWKEDGWFMTPGEFVYILQMEPGYILRTVGLFLLFVGIGILFVLGIVRNNNKHEKSAATNMLSTLQPMQGGAAPVAAPVMQAAPVAPATPVAPQQMDNTLG